MDLFMQETHFPWFQNVLGILDYFSSDADFSPLDGWASTADAAVLQAINDGYLLYNPNINGGKAIGPSGPGSASQKWSDFFFTARDNPEAARSKWGAAEQAGVDYGVDQAAPLLNSVPFSITQAKALAFVELGNVYRAMVANEVHEWPLVHEAETAGFSPLDPRSSISRPFVANVAKAYVTARLPSMFNSELCRRTFWCLP